MLAGLLRDWVETIWNDARQTRLVNEDLTLDKASDEDLEKVWSARAES